MLIVYQLNKGKWLKSISTEIETYINEHSLVGFDEELKVLHCGRFQYLYDENEYFNDIFNSTYEELDEKEYYNRYELKLTNENPHADVICKVECANSSRNEKLNNLILNHGVRIY